MIRHSIYSVAFGLLAAGSPVFAESHLLQPEFTFRRVTPPAAGATQRITVQVAPAAPSGPAAPSAAGTGGATADSGTSAPTTSEYDWFWTSVSPDLDASGPGRLDMALTLLRNPPEGKSVTAPRLQLMQDIASAHGITMLTETIGTAVSPAFVLAVISVESAGRDDATSGAGAQGLMQLMPATAARFGVTDSLNAADNIKGGVAYLDWLMNEFDNDPVLVLAAYNSGENAVKRNEGVPPYAETRGYVPKVLAAWTVARGLCITPPELISDGCVFAVNGG